MSLVGYDSSGSDADADAERVGAGDATVSTGLLEAARVPPIADQESAASTAGSTTTCPPDDLPGEWTECVDAGSGEAYYWNKLTGDTTWERARCFEQIAPSNKRQRTGESMDRIARTEDGAARTGGLGNSFFSELVRRGSVATSAPITGPERSVMIDADTTNAAEIAMRKRRIRMKCRSRDIFVLTLPWRGPGRA